MKGKLDVESETWMRVQSLPGFKKRKRSHSLKGKTIKRTKMCGIDTLLITFTDGTWCALTAIEDWLHDDSSLRDEMDAMSSMGIIDKKDLKDIRTNMERCAKKYANMDEREEYKRLKAIYESDDPPVGLPPGTKFGKILGND